MKFQMTLYPLHSQHTSIFALHQTVWTLTTDDFPSTDLTRIYCDPDMKLMAAFPDVSADLLLPCSIKPQNQCILFQETILATALSLFKRRILIHDNSSISVHFKQKTKLPQQVLLLDTPHNCCEC
jgi:hypothetical protein